MFDRIYIYRTLSPEILSRGRSSWINILSTFMETRPQVFGYLVLLEAPAFNRGRSPEISPWLHRVTVRKRSSIYWGKWSVYRNWKLSSGQLFKYKLLSLRVIYINTTDKGIMLVKEAFTKRLLPPQTSNITVGVRLQEYYTPPYDFYIFPLSWNLPFM